MTCKPYLSAVVLAPLTVLAGLAPALAQAPEPTSLGEFGDWAAYTYKTKSGKVCYVSSQPKAQAPKNAKPDVSRFKGLGEMPADDLKSTTLDPKRRAALRVTIDKGQELETDRVMNELMGKDPQARFRFIMERAADARDIDV